MDGFVEVSQKEMMEVDGGGKVSKFWAGVAVVAGIGAAAATGGTSLWLTGVVLAATGTSVITSK